MANAIILYDGHCVFCHRSVQFIIKKDKKKFFRFAPLQGKIGKELQEAYHVPSEIDSIVLFQNGKFHLKSTAVLQICKTLGGWYKVLFTLMLIPKPIRDSVYNLVAKYRNKISRQTACRLPTEKEKAQFLE